MQIKVLLHPFFSLNTFVYDNYVSVTDNNIGLQKYLNSLTQNPCGTASRVHHGSCKLFCLTSHGSCFSFSPIGSVIGLKASGAIRLRENYMSIHDEQQRRKGSIYLFQGRNRNKGHDNSSLAICLEILNASLFLWRLPPMERWEKMTDPNIEDSFSIPLLTFYCKQSLVLNITQHDHDHLTQPLN